jgi:prolyl-tRNA editing enzyme YbaK/EbsC (Cys-tRNA(Pro) deacylase)
MSRKQNETKPALERVQDELDRLGVPNRVIEFPASTRTSQEAADTVGTSVGQIAKSLVFMAGGEPILVIASGQNRVSEKKLADRLGVEIKRADADEVRASTGFAIGGVPPIAHAVPLVTFIDEDLLAFEEIYAAAGTPRAVFRLTPQQLVQMTRGQVMDLKQ